MPRILYFFFLTVFLTLSNVQAQFFIGSDVNSSLFIKDGETFQFDGLTLSPSGNFTLTNTTLTKTDANTGISPAPNGTYISRYYSFSNTLADFTGTVRFSYAGATLGSIQEADVRLNIRTDARWVAMAESPDMVNDYVQSTLSSVKLNTLTLASVSGALPVSWLGFTAVKKDASSLLNWSTSMEQNTQDFLVQHSTSSSHWTTIGSVKAAGNATVRKDYSYLHLMPTEGYNYYRLIQRDLDGVFSYSKVVSVFMDKEGIKLKAFPNPVQDGRLNVVLKEAVQVRLFDAAGKEVLTQRLNAGPQVLNVSQLQGGVYQLHASGETIAIFIQ